MNKLSYWLIVPLLAFSVVIGAERKSEGKAATQKQEAASVSATIDRAAPVASAEQQRTRTQAFKKAVRSLAKPVMKKPAASQVTRGELLVRQAQNARKETKSRHNRPFGARSAPRVHNLVQPKFAGGGIGTDALSTIAVFTNTSGDTITGYTIGETIVLTVTLTAPVYLEVFVDDGDGSFDPAADLWFDVGDRGEGFITIVDDDIDDEDDTPGVWQMTIDTGHLEGEGDEFFALQGVRLWFNFWTDQASEGELSLDVLAATSSTSISGMVTIQGAAAPNILMVAFGLPDMTVGPEGEEEGLPEAFFLSMTDDSGNYTISIEDSLADHEFIIFAFDLFGLVWGYYPNPPDIGVYIAAGDNLEFLDFDFQPANALIKGRLTDAETTTGIGGVHISVGGGPLELEDTTDASGYYRIPVPGGDYRVEVDSWDLENMGYMVPRNWDNWVYVMDFDTAEVNFETYATDATISGTVLWSDGSPAVDVNVWGDVPGFYTDAWTDVNGMYDLPVSSALDTFDVVDPFDSTYTWTSFGYWVGVWEPETVSQPDGRQALSGDTGVDFTLYGADATMTGVIYDHLLNPVPHANLWAYVESDSGYDWIFSTGTQARADGTYELRLIGGFDWIVEVYPPETWWPPAIRDTISVFPGQNIVRDYYLPERRMNVVVEGMVFNFEGYGIPNASVEIRQTEGGDYNSAVNTDGEGYFRFEGVPTFSSYEVAAFTPDSEPQFYYVYVDDWDIWLEFWMGGFSRVSVSGTVSNPEGDPLEDAYVFAFDQSGVDPIDVRLTDETGFYDFFVEPGTYEFRAGSPGLLVSSTGLIAVDSSLTIDFMLDSAGAALTATGAGHVSDEGGGPIANVFALFISDVYMGQTFTNFSGDYELDLVPDSNYVAIYFKEGFHDEFHRWPIFEGANPGLNVIMMPVDFLVLHTVEDVPDDHGEQIFLAWHVNPILAGNLTRFELWEIGRGAQIDPYRPQGPPARHVGTVPVHPGWTEYSAAVTTLHDGVETWYMVTAHGWDIWDFWDSNPNSGFSFDNLPPGAPQGVIAGGGETANQVVIGWDAANIEPIQYYTIYRSVDGGAFVQLAYSAEPGYVDNLTAMGSYEYTVSATDYGENESARSAGTTYTLLSIVDGMGIPDEFALKANYPNPFNPSTTIAYQMPEAGRVSLVVYDLTGNVVSTLVNESQPAGYYQTVWNGRDQRGIPVATGVYFYRLKAGAEFVKTHKMVLIK
ncbi:MAG: T9SS type A sorting domain-containing protein [Candidatus Marinimicrobia bacterium]|nr:T9SS type A sorting domain-containing protein [Candidatus Neomarinimicrobiota bacterium]